MKEIRILTEEAEHTHLKEIKNELGLTWRNALIDGLKALVKEVE